MSRRTRVVGLALVGVAGLLLAALSVGWWLVTARMEAAVASWRQGQVAAGIIVTAGPAIRSGWPFEAVLVLNDPTLATDAPGQPDSIAWQADQVRLVYVPWRPTAVDVLVGDMQTVRFGAAPPVSLTTTRLDLRIPLDETGQAQGIALAARGISFPLAGGPVRIDSLSVRLRPADAFISAAGVTLPGRSLPFGGTVQSLDLHARTTGPLPPLRDPSAALAAWRDRGQRLLLDEVTVRWGPLDVSGHASLGLDPALQPEGSASVQLTGFAEVIEALARSGAITRSDARVASTLLGLMSRPGADQVAEADLPVSLRDRTLSVGAIPLLRLPVLSVP